MGGGDHDRRVLHHDRPDQLRVVGRHPGRTDVGEDVDAGLERVAHVLRVVDVGVDFELVPVRRVGDRLVVRRAELHVGLDRVDARLRQPLGRPRGLLGGIHQDLGLERR